MVSALMGHLNKGLSYSCITLNHDIYNYWEAGFSGNSWIEKRRLCEHDINVGL